MWSRLRSKSRRPPFLLHYRSAEWFIVTSIAIAIFSETLIYAIFIPVLPFALVSRARVERDEVQRWTATLLAVHAGFQIAFSPLSGWIADRTSTRRGPLLLSYLLLAGATLLLMFGRSIGTFIAARALQGAAAAAGWTIGLALLVDTVGVDQMGEASGWVSFSSNVGILSGPLLGGVLYEKAGYYSVFYMCLGIIALDIVLRLLIVEKRVARRWLEEKRHTQSIDDAEKADPQQGSPSPTSAPVIEVKQGVPSSSVSNLDSTSHDSITPQPPPPPPAEESPSRVPDQTTESNTPTQPPHTTPHPPAIWTILTSKRILVPLWAALVAATISTSFDTILPIRVANLFHFNSLGAGLIFLAIIIPTLASALVGKLTDRLGARLITTAGFLVLSPTLVCLRFVDHDSVAQKALLCALLAVCGAASSMLLVPVMAEVAHCVESAQKMHPERFGAQGAFAQGYGVMNGIYAVGTLVGPIWSGFMIDGTDWATTTWTLGLLAGVTAIPMFLLLGGWVGRRGWKAELLSPESEGVRKDRESKALVAVEKV
ncbi:MFS general substrate transporter [Pseudovirgaria hyperparasitica]|uniref:MFS general substrate transporter n=1 Tax=Pseudovirgaria hyperparasitica TaxID=470096 RepID=A0A6A6W672_9PEZI|nr:MFS general substrate transporter [Pseudovirgaria hyperparasitica]KAF2758113.1 MFS general substrate transporter [Pseudovirgaria hyperparasitica]